MRRVFPGGCAAEEIYCESSRIGPYFPDFSLNRTTIRLKIEKICPRFPAFSLRSLLPHSLLGLVSVLMLASVAVGQDRGRKGDRTPEPFEILADLVETYGVSGFEAPVRDKVGTYLPSWTRPRVDEKGNLLVTFGSGPEHLVFVAHLDEIGYVVDDIRADGTLAVDRRGGYFDRYFEARPVLVHSGRGPISGIISPRLGYFRSGEAKAEFETDDIRVYLGTDTRSDTEALGIRPGDSITVPKRFVPLANGRATARSFDDRTGCTALILALQDIDPSEVRKKITFAWVVEEETGLHGARHLAARADADFVFAVDTFVSSDSPREDKRFGDAPLGSGFVIRALDTSNITPIEFVDRVIGIANQHNVPVQVGSTNGGNDGSTFTRYGAIDIPIAWPLRYSHSPVEILEKTDLEALADIIRHLVSEF